MIDWVSLITLGAVVLGALVNIFGIVAKHDSQIIADANRDAKLTAILEKIEDLGTLESTVKGYGDRIFKVEECQKNMGLKLDELCKEHKENMKPLKCGGMNV